MKLKFHFTTCDALSVMMENDKWNHRNEKIIFSRFSRAWTVRASLFVGMGY